MSKSYRQNVKSHLRNHEMIDTRNYDHEARNMLSTLGTMQKYELLEIVLQKLQFGCSDVRRKELEAVRKIILQDRSLDRDRVNSMINGPRSEMARTARAKDGNTRKSPKKV